MTSPVFSVVVPQAETYAYAPPAHPSNRHAALASFSRAQQSFSANTASCGHSRGTPSPTLSYTYACSQVFSWPSRDPIGERGGLNRYGFVDNSPVCYVDELGLKYGNPVSGPGGPVGPGIPSEPGGPYGNTGTCPADSGILDSARALYNEWANALAELQKAKADMEKASVIGADKYFHCMGSCNAARSGSRRASDTLGRLREIEELTRQRVLWHLKRYGIECGCLKVKQITDPKTGQKRDLLPIEHAKDSLEDYEANKTGFDCPAEKTCEECCCKYKVKGL